MADGFLGRWSRRKQDVREGKAVAELPAPARAAAPLPVQQAGPSASADGAPGALPAVPPARSDAPAAEAPPPPTLADAQALTPESDFTPFVQRTVPADVRNLAMKKLFADPHFNVMDGLDIYIDDYTQPDPLPAGMLQKMASAHAMGFFAQDPAAQQPGPQGEVPDPTAGVASGTAIAQQGTQPRVHAEEGSPGDVAQSQVCKALPSQPPSEPGAVAFTSGGCAASPASPPDHDHDAHLRLQPDDAPRREGARDGTA